MEMYSRRENIKFVGVPEEADTFGNSNKTEDGAQPLTENTKEVVYKFLEEKLKTDLPRDKIEFQRVHRFLT